MDWMWLMLKVTGRTDMNICLENFHLLWIIFRPLGGLELFRQRTAPRIPKKLTVVLLVSSLDIMQIILEKPEEKSEGMKSKKRF